MSNVDVRLRKLEQRLLSPTTGEMWEGVPLSGLSHEDWVDELDRCGDVPTEPAKQGTASV